MTRPKTKAVPKPVGPARKKAASKPAKKKPDPKPVAQEAKAPEPAAPAPAPPVNPAGTTPGLSGTVERKKPPVFITCKRCKGVQADIVTPEGFSPGSIMYRCVSCKHVWGLNIGSAIDI